MSEEMFERRGTQPRPRVVRCEFCDTPLVDPIEAPFNLAFIDHLKTNALCMERFSYGMQNLRNEIRVRYHQKPELDGL